MRKSLILAKKDLKIEFRNRSTLNLMFLFSFIILLTFNFASDPFSTQLRDIAPGLLWFVLLFAGLLGISKTFIKEIDSGTIEGLKSAPISYNEILIGKIIYNLTLIIIIEIITFPLFMVLFNYTIAGNIFSTLAILTLGSIGFVVVGSFISALIIGVQNRGLMLQVIAMPLLIPVIISTILALREVMIFGKSIFDISEIIFIVGYVLIMATLSLLLFEYVLEE
jgi:heme exporter protein B|tara:strand:+ start:70 stop:738 length:669 start_codon:yes stop_codon:yes gene_type:complete